LVRKTTTKKSSLPTYRNWKNGWLNEHY
jgi:hypothetical protein